MKFVIFGSFVFFASICIYLIFRRKKYTRERFAFFSTLLLFTFATSVVTHIFTNISFLNIIIFVLNTLPFGDVSIQQTSWSDKIWSVVIFIILVAFVKSIFDGWTKDGAISKNDFALMSKKRSLSFSHAVLDGAKPFSISLNAPEKTKRSTKKYDLSHLDETLAWHIEVKELLLMSSQHYKISDVDWYSEKNAYLSQYSNQPILICCEHSRPKLSDVKETISYFSEHTGQKITRAIVAIKDRTDHKNIFEFDGCSVEIKNKSEILDCLVNFEDYYEHLKSQFSGVEITEGDRVTLEDIYVESSADIVELKEGGEGIYVESVEKYLSAWAENEGSSKHVTLLGEYGQGKSVLSLKLALKIFSLKCNRVPIIIELRGKSPRNETVATIIASWALRFDINVKAMQKLLQEGRLIIILEGFDELDMVGNAYRRLEHFKKLWEFARYRKSKVIITGRPNLFLDNQEARKYLHLENDSSDLFQVDAVNLRPFTRKQIEKALRSTNDSVRDEILSLFDNGKEGIGFRDLISRPSTLYQTSIIWDILDKRNINSAGVIDEFINHAYRRQAEKLQSLGPTGIEPLVLTAKEREYFMLGVAVGMIKRTGYSNQISRNALNEIVTSLYYESPDCISLDHSTSIPLQIRLKDDPDALDSVFNDVRTAGIIVRDLTGIKTFKFAHKSFLELLFAKCFVGLISKREDEIVYNSIVNANSIEKIFSKLDFSDEVISHIAELIAKNIDPKEDNVPVETKLLKTIAPQLIMNDYLLFRRFFGVTMIGGIIILVTCTLSFISLHYVQSVIEEAIKEPLILNDPIIKILNDPIIKIYFIVVGLSCILSIAPIFRFKIAREFYAPFEIWQKTCEKLDIECEKSSTVSKNLIRFFRKEFNFHDRIILALMALHKNFMQTIKNFFS